MLSKSEAEVLECLIANNRDLKLVRRLYYSGLKLAEAERLLAIYDNKKLVSHRANGLYSNESIINGYLAKNLSIKIK